MDLISRQAAIDGADKIIERDTSGNNDVVKAMTAWKEWIKGLPSAQLEPDQWCTDCAEYDSERHCCPRWNRVIRHTVDDLKAAQPERKRGQWIFHPEQRNIYGGICIECSECREKYVVQYVSYEKFCRNCGTRMER